MRVVIGVICGIVLVFVMAGVFAFSSMWREDVLDMARFWQGSASGAGNNVQVDTAPELPIPRFVSIKDDLVNIRRGPSLDHDIAWQFVRKGEPVEIIAEYDHWRRIRDVDGEEGWVYHVMLSGKRTALVAPWGEDLRISLLAERDVRARRVAMLESGALAHVEECDGEWCRLSFLDFSQEGWIKQKALWGVYIGEQVN